MIAVGLSNYLSTADSGFSQIEYPPGFSIPPQQRSWDQRTGRRSRKQVPAGVMERGVGCRLFTIHKDGDVLWIGQRGLREVNIQLLRRDEKVHVVRRSCWQSFEQL